MRKLHYNAKQMQVTKVDANVTMVVAGRGVGKSTSIIAPRAIRCAFSMHKSHGLYVAQSFMQLKTKTLPPVIEGWRKLGYVRDRDYVIGKRGPAHWKTPYFMPVDDLKNFVHFRNGSGASLISMQKEGSANGMSSDYVIGDEVKFWDRERFSHEIIPTMRGSSSGPSRVLWENNALWKSLLMCTDMPQGRSSDWIFEYEKLMDRGQVQLIEYVYEKQQKKVMAYYQSDSESYKKRLNDEIKALEVELNDLRKDCVFYMEASALDNLEVLGKSYLKSMKRELSPLTFETSVLNKRIRRAENGFYPDFDPDIHGRDYSNDDYIDELGYDFDKLLLVSTDCRADSGLVKKLPLEVGLDNGGDFNCVVTGQNLGTEVRINSGHHVHEPQLVRDLAHKWCDYYEPHKPYNRDVIYYFDHTAYPKYGTTVETYKKQWIDTLSSRGWNVIEVNIGFTPDYEVRHALHSDVCSNARADLPSLSYNINRCESLEISICNAGVKIGAKGLQKDKDTEKQKKKVKPQHSTHYSDAYDTFLYGTIKKRKTVNNNTLPGGVV